MRKEFTAKEILEETANAILQEGIDFVVTYDKPNLLRRIGILPKERKFVIYPVCLGALIRISKEILTIDNIVPPQEGENHVEYAIRVIANNADKLVKIVAIAIVNNHSNTSQLENFIRENMTSAEILKLLNIVVRQMDVSGFLSSIMSVRGMSLLSKEEIIASGQ